MAVRTDMPALAALLLFVALWVYSLRVQVASARPFCPPSTACSCTRWVCARNRTRGVTVWAKPVRSFTVAVGRAANCMRERGGRMSLEAGEAGEAAEVGKTARAAPRCTTRWPSPSPRWPCLSLP